MFVSDDWVVCGIDGSVKRKGMMGLEKIYNFFYRIKYKICNFLKESILFWEIYLIFATSISFSEILSLFLQWVTKIIPPPLISKIENYSIFFPLCNCHLSFSSVLWRILKFSNLFETFFLVLTFWWKFYYLNDDYPLCSKTKDRNSNIKLYFFFLKALFLITLIKNI